MKLRHICFCLIFGASVAVLAVFCGHRADRRTVRTAEARIPEGCDVSNFIRYEKMLSCTARQKLPSFEALSGLLTNITHLQLDSCNFSTLPNGSFSRLTVVKDLEMNCALSYRQWQQMKIEDGVFEPLRHVLDRLAITGTGVSIGSTSLCPMSKLTFLDLSRSGMTDATGMGLPLCQNDIVSGCEALLSLYELDLSNNSLSVVKPFCSMPSLERLLLEDNILEEIWPYAFARLSQLAILDLGHNRLTHLRPEYFFNLTKLTNLILSFNFIQNINGMFIYLKEHPERWPPLRCLLLNDNNITDIGPGTFDGLHAPDVLQLSNNNITKIHDEAFSNLARVGNLCLSNNHLSELPKFGALASTLTIYNADGNMLEVIHGDTFRNATALIQLNLAHNFIRVIWQDAFNSLVVLKKLFLDHNRLQLSDELWRTLPHSITPYSVFLPLRNLEDLYLSHNCITEVNYSYLPYFLKNLVLSFNSIKSIRHVDCDDGSVDPVCLPYLEVLDLSNNVIKDLSKIFIPYHIHEVDLSHNAIQSVSFDTLWIFRYLRRINLSDNQIGQLSPWQRQNGWPSNRRALTAVALMNNSLQCTQELCWLLYVGQQQETSDEFIFSDFSQLTCFNAFHRDRPQVVHLSDSSRHTCNFLKSFQKFSIDDSQVCSQMSSRKGLPSNAHCDISCPSSCSCYHDKNWNTVNVNCAQKNLTNVPLDIPPITSSLYLDQNGVRQLLGEDFQWLTSLSRLYMNANILDYIEYSAFATLRNLTILHLDHNYLHDLSPGLFKNLVNLQELFLSHNRLFHIDDKLFNFLTNLKLLTLDNNKLIHFNVRTFQGLPALSELSLAFNPWTCDCDFILNFTHWKQTYSGVLQNSDQIYCVVDSDGDNPIMNYSLTNFNTTSCYESSSTNVIFDTTNVTILIVSLSLIAFVSLTAVLGFLYRYEMQVLIYSRFGVRFFHDNESEDDKDKVFDAFISYTSLDEDFVVQELMPGLENTETPYSLCLHHRDFIVGAYITDNILKAVRESRRTIMVLSRNFVQSEWCRFEFKTAHVQMLKDRRCRVIIVLLGDMPDDMDDEIKLYMRTNTYLCWGDRLFWKKLYFAMPNKKTATMTPVTDNM